MDGEYSGERGEGVFNDVCIYLDLYRYSYFERLLLCIYIDYWFVWVSFMDWMYGIP